MKSLSFHRRNLPHIYQSNSTYFVTFRVKDSITLEKLLHINNKYEKLRNKPNADLMSVNMNYFYEYDNLLHDYDLGNYLDKRELAIILQKELHKSDGRDLKLIAYSIMPNHIHVILHLMENSRNIGQIMQTIKRISAFYINKQLERNGNFWQSESYDHIVRNQDELEKIIEYTLLNPVKAGLVEDWRDFEFNYLSDEC